MNISSHKKLVLVQKFPTYLDSLQVHCIHDGSLEESYGGEVSLYQTLQLKSWRCSEYKKMCHAGCENLQHWSGFVCGVLPENAKVKKK